MIPNLLVGPRGPRARVRILATLACITIAPPSGPLTATQDSLPLATDRRLRFTTSEGTWMSLDVSPDGRTIVFDLLGDLYTIPIAGGDATRITSGQAFDQQPRFSPDGRSLVFVSDKNGADNVWLADADGQNARPMTDDTRRLFISPEWTPDGDYIVVTRTSDVVNRPQDFHLMLYHKRGGEGVQLTGGDAPLHGENDFRVRAHLGAAFGRDPRFVYLSAAPSRGYGNWQLAILDRGTGRVFRRTQEPQSAMRPTVSPDGRYLVYGTRIDGTTALKLVELASGDERWLVRAVDRDDQEGLPTRDLMPGSAFTPDGTALITAFGGKLHRIDVTSGAVTDIPFTADVDVPLGPLARFEFSLDEGPVTARRIEHVRMSPDGSRITFTALGRVWIMELPDGRPRRLTNDDIGEYFPTWSPDGRHVAYVTWDDLEGGDINRAPVGGGPPQRLTTRKAFYERLSYSPDGLRIVAARGPRSRRIAFYDELIRGRAPSTALIWIPATGGDARTITPLQVTTRWAYTHHGIPHFTGDTSRVFFLDPFDGLVSVRWDGSERRTVVDLESWEWTYNPQVPADEILMAPTGKRALALANGSVYLVEVPPTSTHLPTISLTNLSSSSLPVRKLSTVGADYIGWNADGRRAYWAIGRTLYVLDVDADSAAPTTYDVTVTAEHDVPVGTVVLRGGRAITMRGAEVIDNADIVVTNNRIAAIGPRGSVSIPNGAREIDVSGKMILPGYVDIHAHMWAPWGVHRKQVWEYVANLAYGVTTTRDPQTMTSDVITYADRVATGEIIGPRIYSTARGVFASEDFKGLDDARNVLRRYSDHYRTETIKNYLIGDRKHRQWLVQAARELRLSPTAEGNSDFKMNLTLALDGYAGVEHSFPVFPLYGDVVRLLAESGITYTPTLIINLGGPAAENYFYREQGVHDDPKLRRFIPHAELDRRTLRRSVLPHESQWVFEQEAEQAAKIVQAGGRVGLGGHGQLQGMGVHWELWLMASGGMSNHDALRTGTVFPAEAIGHLADLGTLEAGKLADLQILDANPLDDIRNTTSITHVMINGRLYETDTLSEVWPRQRQLPEQWWWREFAR